MWLEIDRLIANVMVTTTTTTTTTIIIIIIIIITGPRNGPVLFCWLSSYVVLSSVVVCNAAGGRAGQRPGAWTAARRRRAHGRSGGRHCMAGQSCYVPLGRHLVVIIIITGCAVAPALC